MSSSSIKNETSSAVAAPQKKQPWKAVWPAERESQPQAQIFGFEKGERMVFDGNAGNFFVRDGWVVEADADASRGVEAADEGKRVDKDAR